MSAEISGNKFVLSPPRAVDIKYVEIAGNEISLLVVDENPAILALASAILEPAGFRILRARSSFEAMEICSREYVALDGALIDVVLPGGSGPELAGALRGKRPGLPVLYMAAFEDMGAIRISLSGRAEDQKTGEPEVPVAEAIRVALSRAHA